MSRIQKIAVWRTPDGVLHEDLVSAQKALKKIAFSEAIAKIVDDGYAHNMSRDEISGLIVENYDDIIAAMRKADEASKVVPG